MSPPAGLDGRIGDERLGGRVSLSNVPPVGNLGEDRPVRVRQGHDVRFRDLGQGRQMPVPSCEAASDDSDVQHGE